MSHSYPSDISREQFVRILPTLESARYLLKSGCQWRMLPADFSNWRTCYKYFRQWSERPGPGQDSILEQVLKKIGWRGPTKQWTERGVVADLPGPQASSLHASTLPDQPQSLIMDVDFGNRIDDAQFGALRKGGALRAPMNSIGGSADCRIASRKRYPTQVVASIKVNRQN